MSPVGVRYRGIAYRAHHPGWAYAPLSGEGAALHGGRFNAHGVPALYLSLRPQTAWLEAQQAFPFKAQPLTLCAYEIDREAIADPRLRATCLALEISTADIGCAWEKLALERQEPPTWALARRARAQGLDGLIYPSQAFAATSDDDNLVLWRWDRGVTVIDDFNRLPKNDSSWR